MEEPVSIPFPLSVYDGVVQKEGDEIWIRSGDMPTVVARKITAGLRDGADILRLAAIGQTAVNQAMKGVAVARQMWRDISEGSDLYTSIYFSTVIDSDNKERTRLIIAVFSLDDDYVVRRLRR